MTAGRPTRPRGWVPIVIAALILAAAFGAYLFARQSGPLARIEQQTLDWRFRLRGPLPGNDEIILVLVDDASLEALGGWPLPRRELARAVDRLAAAGAQAIAIDLLFTEALARDDPAGDAALARAIAEAGRVILPLAFRFEAQGREGPPAGLSRAAFRLVRYPPGAGPTMQFQPTGVLAPPNRYLERASAGHVNLFPGGSDVVRTVHLAIPYGENLYPALALELARVARGVERDQTVAVVGKGVRMAGRFIETDAAMRAAIDYRSGSGGFARYSLVELVENSVPDERLRNRIVLIGAAATGLGDSFATPYGERLPGVALLATITDNVLKDRFLETGARAQSVDLAALALGGLVLLLLIARRRFGWASVAAGFCLFMWLAVAQIAFTEARLWLNASLPALAFLLLGGVSLIFLARSERGGRRRAEARGAALGRYVSPLAEQHLERGGGPQAVQAIVMFVDMRGFTRASESAAPGDVAERLRAFHERVAQAVANHGGVIDKYLGDGVLILFGTDGGGPREAAAALRCARELSGKSAGQELGIGLHFGPLTIGEMGGAGRAEVSVAGDTINVASRLQEMTKEFGARIVASDAVVTAAQAWDKEVAAGFEAQSGQAIRGRERPLDIWIWRGDG